MLNSLNKLNNFNNQKYKQNLQLQRTKTTTTLNTDQSQISISVVARFCREIEHVLSDSRIWRQQKFGTRLYDKRARNRRQFSGAGFWSVCHGH